MTIWPLRPIWGVWKLYQWISHAQRPADRHRNQVSSILRTKVRSWPFYHILGSHKWRFGHSGKSGVSENGPNGFPMPKNLGIDTKIKSLAGSGLKLEVGHFTIFWVAINAHKWRFGHSGQSEVFENGPNGFPMLKNLGMDTKNQVSSMLRTKARSWSFYHILGSHKWP